MGYKNTMSTPTLPREELGVLNHSSTIVPLPLSLGGPQFPHLNFLHQFLVLLGELRHLLLQRR